MSDPIQLATERFAQGLSCSQAVFSSLASHWELSDELALRIASPFGGGIARQGSVCGALTGALMALGLERGNDTPQHKEETYQISQELVNRFKELHGTILCRDLIGYDLSTTEGLQSARESKVFSTVCPKLVEEAARLASEFLHK